MELENMNNQILNKQKIDFIKYKRKNKKNKFIV